MKMKKLPGKESDSSHLRIAVIGTINSDTIFLPDGHRLESLGGILYNIRALAQLMGPRVEIIPVTNVGRDLAEPILAACSACGSVNLDAVRIVPHPHNRCTMRYRTPAERSETLSGGVGAISWPQIEFALQADLILVNFISGYDISWRNLQRLRREYRGPIHLDFHSRTLALAHDGSRYLRPPPRWQEYLCCADYLQMNEPEYRTLSGEAASRNGCLEFARLYLSPSAAMFVTLGDSGCFVVEPGPKRQRCIHLRALDSPTICQTTGCGDVFAAGFLSARLQGHSVQRAAKAGNSAASLAAGCSIPEQLDLSGLCF
ncbi:MAG: carbohydrate kinase family protein [bacterium]